MGQILYFASGADMRRDVLEKRCPGADWLGLARLEDHRFVIGPHGLANIQSRRGEQMWGVLWFVPAGALAALDTLAGVGEGLCERTTRRIISPAGPRTEAMLYLTGKVGEGEATADYLDAVLVGARESKLPPTYLAELETWVGKRAALIPEKRPKDSR